MIDRIVIFSLRIYFLKNFGNSKLIDLKKGEGGRFRAIDFFTSNSRILEIQNWLMWEKRKGGGKFRAINWIAIFSFRIHFLKNFENSKLIDVKKKRGGGVDFERSIESWFFPFRIHFLVKNFENSKLINVKKRRGGRFRTIDRIAILSNSFRKEENRF